MADAGVFIIFALMTFYEKYKQLKDETYLAALLSDTVYSTMYLENQEVPKARIREIVLSELKEYKSKSLEFLLNKTAE